MNPNRYRFLSANEIAKGTIAVNDIRQTEIASTKSRWVSSIVLAIIASISFCVMVIGSFNVIQNSLWTVIIGLALCLSSITSLIMNDNRLTSKARKEISAIEREILEPLLPFHQEEIIHGESGDAYRLMKVYRSTMDGRLEYHVYKPKKGSSTEVLYAVDLFAYICNQYLSRKEPADDEQSGDDEPVAIE